ncbi:uncharacterized protein [Panulirus ornatus]|uniref:uncharacterized protein n=1 Tax=Panulirus ornatus TaxID=150431 RepID=UPI003A872D32
MMILNSDKYSTETFETVYRIHMKLTIFNFSRYDNTTYKCVAKNSLGETEGDIKLNEIYMPPKAKEIRSGNSKSEDLTYEAVKPGRGNEDQQGHDLHDPASVGHQGPDDSPPVPHPTNHVASVSDVSSVSGAAGVMSSLHQHHLQHLLHLHHHLLLLVVVSSCLLSLLLAYP